MSIRLALDVSAIKKDYIAFLSRTNPLLLRGGISDSEIDLLIEKNKNSQKFIQKYLLPPEVALKNKSAAIGDEISKVLASHKKILAGTGLEGEIYTTNEDVNIASQYGDDVYDKVKGLLQEKRRIDSYLQPGKNPDRMGLLEIFGLTGKRDITRKTVATKGTANIAGGVGSTFLGGMSYLGSGPKSDEETVAEINYLREHDDFYKTVFPEKLELGDKTVIDKGLHTAANLVGIGPEFKVAGAITSSLKATRILSYVAKNPAAKPFVENLFKLTQVPGPKGRIAKAVLHGVDNMPMFAAHSAFKSAPEDMGKAALQGVGSGLAFGIGGQLARSGGGLGTAEWLKGMAGAGAGFAAPVAMIEAIEGESLSEIGENFAANYITGMGLHAFTYRSVSGFKKGYKERTGVDLDEAMGSKEEADKFAKVMVNGGKNVQSLMKWKTLFNLKDEYFDMEKAKYEKSIASEAGQPQAAGPKPPQSSISAEEPEYKPKANTPGEGLIEYANGNELQRSSFGDVNTFIGKVLGSPDINNETRNKLPGQFLDIASKAEWVDDFVVKAKEHLSSINGIDNEQLGNNDQLLRKIYHGYKRVSGNDKRQIKRKVLAIDSDNPRLVNYNDFARSSNRNDSDIDYLSPLAEITGNRLSVVSAYKKDGKEIRMSDLTEVEVAKAAEKFQAGGLYMLPMKGDSGDMLLVEKHPLMDNKEQYDIAAKELEAHGVLDKVQNKEFAINNHMYFKDFFGEDYVKDILENNPKFQNVQELTKRMTIALAKGITPESPAYADMYDIVDGKVQIPCIIVYDSKLTQETDGIIEPHNKFLDRTLQTTGVQDQPIYARTGKKISPIANIKPFIFHRDNKLGTFMAKMNFNRQPEARQAEIEKLTGGSGLVIYSSSAKYKGKRKVYDPASGEDPAAYRFNISPESIRILKHEHMKYLDEDGNPVVHREKMDRQLSYYMEAPFFQEFFKRADIEMQITLKEAFSSPEKFQKFLKEEVLRVEDTEPEDEYEAETREFNTTTEKILNEYGYTKSAAQLPMVKSYVQQAIHNYIVKRITQPHITGGVFVMAGRPDWVKPILGEDRRNIVLGHHASYMKIDHLFKNNKITVEIDEKEMNASKLLNRGIVTLGDLFNKYPKASVLVGSDRAPIDDIGGVRAHRIVGIGPEGTGSSVYLHPEEMKYLGGADNDYDTMKIYMEQGKHWHDTLLNKYNNMDYNKQDNDSSEELVSSGKFTQMVKSVIPEDDTFIKDAPQGLASLYDNRSYIKSAKSMNNAKTSIGSLMSLDRILRTMMAHGTLKIPAGKNYDAAMKVWKKAVVDAKQGGLPPWDKTKRFMVDQVFGKGTADKVFGVFNRKTRTWDTPKSADYSNVQDLYGHIFGRNWAENQAWTPDEVQNAVNDYFKNGEHNRTQLEEIVSHIPKLDLSIFPDLDVNKLSKFYKDYNISAGALKSNSELFRKFIADPNYEPTDKEISDFATRHKVKEFTPTAENIKSAFTDFIMNDINTVVTKKIYNTLASRINPKLKDQLDSVLARLFIINKAIQEREYQGKSLTQKELTELSTKRETLLGGINASLDKYKNPVLDDYVGIHFIGSVWNPKYPVFQDHSSKFGWQRWMGSNLMQSYVTQVNSKYNSILKTSAKKPTAQPTPVVQPTAVPGVQPGAISNKPISAARRQKMLEAEVNEQIFKLNLKPDKETQIWINKAQRALVDFGKEATGVWDILQFVKTSIHRPTEHQYDFDRYPINKEEAKKLFFDAYRTAAGLRTWRKTGNRTMYINALYKMSTPETLSQAFPETKDWFKKMVDWHIIAENHLVEFNGAMNDIVAEAKEMGGTELIGQVAYDMRIDKLDDATIAKKYPELSRDDILKVRNNIAPKLTELFKLIKPVLESGFEYMKKNMENTWRAQGMNQTWINKQLSEMTLGNIEDYWPGYVTDMEYFAGQKAEQMAQDIINGTMQPGQLSDGFANVKRRDKDRAMPYQKDLEKVLNTYISSVVQWNKRQHIKYHSTQFLKNMSDKAASLSGPNKDMYDQALIYFSKLSDHVNKHKDPTIGDNLTNALMSLSFIKNIVGSVSSATKNYTQQLPGAINAGLVGKWSRDDLMKHQFNAVDEFGIKITGEKILHDATAKAGLTYAQTQGETGEKIDRPDVVMKAMKLAAEYEQDKGAKRKIWGLEKSRELANLLSEFANTGAEGKVKIKGKERKYQFGWMSFKGAETSNRSLTFQRAFSRKFGFWYDYYRKYLTPEQLSEKDLIEIAKNKAMRAGVDVVQLTQFDYHGYNTPEILRKEGFKGNSLKLALQFSKYTVGLYRMYKQMLLNATAEAKYSSGKAKILNESASKLASIMATHAGLMILGNWWGLELYNYVQEDKLSSIRDLFYWAYGKVTDNMDTIEPKLGFYAQKEGPIPYLLGPTFGPLVSMGMMGIDEMTGNSGEGGLTDFTWNEWMQKDVYPRGPKKLANLVERLSKKNPMGIFNFFGAYKTPRKSKN